MIIKQNYTNHIDHYKKDASTFDFFQLNAFMQQEWRRRYETIFHLLKIRDNARILDIGAGGGLAYQYIKEKDFQYIPLDIATLNLKKITEQNPKKIHPVSGDVYHLPFQENTFDVILMTEVLEHLENPLNALKNILKILKQDGQFIVSVPYREKIVYHLCIHCNKPTPANAHLHTFDESIMKELIVSAGFNPVKSIKCLNKPFNRLHGNRLLKSFPYTFWKLTDTLMNKVVNKPASLILQCSKQAV